MNRYRGRNFAIGLCIAIAFLVITVRAYAARKLKYSRPGSVADLVRRGQLRSDRRGMYEPNPEHFRCFPWVCSRALNCKSFPHDVIGGGCFYRMIWVPVVFFINHC